MADIEKRLASWRRFAGTVEHPEAASRATDWVTAHHRQQLERSAPLVLENLKAHDLFCQQIEAYVTQHANTRSEEHQQRVTDYAGFALRMYENATSRALEKALINILTDLPIVKEVEVVRTVQPAPPPQRSLIDRLLNG
jgi:hypothetical protein